MQAAPLKETLGNSIHVLAQQGWNETIQLQLVCQVHGLSHDNNLWVTRTCRSQTQWELQCTPTKPNSARLQKAVCLTVQPCSSAPLCKALWLLSHKLVQHEAVACIVCQHVALGTCSGLGAAPTHRVVTQPLALALHAKCCLLLHSHHLWRNKLQHAAQQASISLPAAAWPWPWQPSSPSGSSSSRPALRQSFWGTQQHMCHDTCRPNDQETQTRSCAQVRA